WCGFSEQLAIAPAKNLLLGWHVRVAGGLAVAYLFRDLLRGSAGIVHALLHFVSAWRRPVSAAQRAHPNFAIFFRHHYLGRGTVRCFCDVEDRAAQGGRVWF